MIYQVIVALWFGALWILQTIGLLHDDYDGALKTRRARAIAMVFVQGIWLMVGLALYRGGFW
jgi:hypothetical protein